MNTWFPPNIGDIILLKQGFELNGQNSGPHYGLVVGIFKIKGSHVKRLMISPGTTFKWNDSFNVNEEIVIKGRSGFLGSDTKFYFTTNEIVIYSFPSEDILESNRCVHGQQIGQINSIVCTLPNIRSELISVRTYYVQLWNLYKDVLKIWGIQYTSIVNISEKKPFSFLK